MKYILLTILLCINAFRIFPDELDDQIASLSKEIKDISKEIDKVREEEDKDLQKFKKYEERTNTYQSNIKSETDSLRLEVSKLTIINDSLSSLIYSIENRINNISLKEKDTKLSLIHNCKALDSITTLLPPSISVITSNTIRFLQNELEQKNISSLEGIHRLGKIISQIQEYEMDIQVSQATSPIKEINGQVNILRIGTCFEAMVDNDAKVFALWNRNLETSWEIIENNELAQNILEAIRIHEGKSIPSLTHIPFNIAKGE